MSTSNDEIVPVAPPDENFEYEYEPRWSSGTFGCIADTRGCLYTML